MRIDIPVSVRGSELVAVSPFERSLEAEGNKSEEGEERSNGEGADKVVVIIECLNLQRHGVGFAADVTGNDADCSKLPHRSGVAQKHAIEEGEANIWQGDVPKRLPPRGAEGQRCFLVGAALRCHQRDQLTSN